MNHIGQSTITSGEYVHPVCMYPHGSGWKNQSIELVPHLQVVAVVGQRDDSMAPVHQEPYPGQKAIVNARRGQQPHLVVVFNHKAEGRSKVV